MRTGCGECSHSGEGTAFAGPCSLADECEGVGNQSWRAITHEEPMPELGHGLQVTLAGSLSESNERVIVATSSILLASRQQRC
jgi:hypothetical protein